MSNSVFENYPIMLSDGQNFGVRRDSNSHVTFSGFGALYPRMIGGKTDIGSAIG